jgi:hypothetical protein
VLELCLIRFEVRVLRVVEENYGRLAIARRRLGGREEEGEAAREGWAAKKKKKKPKSGRQRKERGKRGVPSTDRSTRHVFLTVLSPLRKSIFRATGMR